MSTSETRIDVQFAKSLQLISGYLQLSHIPEDSNLTTIPTPTPTEAGQLATAIFPLSALPSELRHEIYAHYFASLPPHHITCSSISEHKKDDKALEFHALNALNALAKSSPSIASDIPPWLYYHNTTFQFSCPSALQAFVCPSHSPSSSTPSFPSASTAKQHIRKIKILYGNISEQGPDWVFLVLNGFKNIGEIHFVVQEGCRCCGVVAGSEKMDGWWKCIKDAVREGVKDRFGDGRKRKGNGKGKGIRLLLEVRRGDNLTLLTGAEV